MQTIIIGGSSSSGKTSILKNLIKILREDCSPCVCKIDCIKSDDILAYKKLNIPVIQGLSNDICPDHYLATNLLEIFSWGLSNSSSHLFIETAGLCNRCAPFIDKTLNMCVIDAMGSIQSPEKLGPLLATADVIAISKVDLVSQAEREVLSQHLSILNPRAKQFEVNGVSGFGSQRLSRYIREKARDLSSLEGSTLVHKMPSANCAYCVGEIRIGNCFQQGMIDKICIGDDNLDR